jgi:hypothetical protein
MAAKAWRGCMEPDDAAFFSLTQGDQAVWGNKLCWNSWAMRNKAGQPSPSKRHRQQETSGGIEHLPLDLALRVREAWKYF